MTVGLPYLVLGGVSFVYPPVLEFIDFIMLFCHKSVRRPSGSVFCVTVLNDSAVRKGKGDDSCSPRLHYG